MKPLKKFSMEYINWLLISIVISFAYQGIIQVLFFPSTLFILPI